MKAIGSDREIKPDLREAFADKLSETQAWFYENEIDFRIFGSLATSAYIDQPDQPRLDFNRSQAFTPDQRVPDIDVLVPRDALKVAQEYSKKMRESDFPVNIETLFPEFYIDYRPKDEDSFLMHKTMRTKIDSKLFKPVIRPFLNTSITTVDPRTLFHTYVTCGGLLRQKDRPKALALARGVQNGTIPTDFMEQDYAMFHAFIAKRKENYPTFIPFKQACQTVGNVLPSRTRQRIIYHLLPAVRAMLKAT